MTSPTEDRPAGLPDTATTSLVATQDSAATTRRADALPLAGRKAAGNIVEFRNVTKTYNEGTAQAFTAIEDIRFEIEDLHGKGEFIAILGPSGSGKSTILRMLAGLDPQHPPTSGEVLVAGQIVTSPGADRGMVFQDYTSFDNRTVLDNVAFGLECRCVPKTQRYAKARDWIRRVGLDVASDAGKFPHELSGGMRQRVAIARTLILHPRIILMDEPFGALDPHNRFLMQDLLVELWREVQATVFFITHSIEEAVYLGDRVFILSRSPGRLLHQIPLPSPSPSRPAAEMQREPAFRDKVIEIREILEKLESRK